MSEEDDRREYPRTPIELSVEYRNLNTFFYDYTKNISKGGTFIKTARPLDIGTAFLFKLTIPLLPEPLTLTGEVKWIIAEEDVGKDPRYDEPGMGIQFIYKDDRERRVVEEIVEKLMREQLGDLVFHSLLGK